MNKWIAVRRQPRSAEWDWGSVALSTRRSVLVNEPVSGQEVSELEALGLQNAPPNQRHPDADHAFQHLPYLDAFVIDTTSRAVVEQAKEVLEPQYLVTQDVALSLPAPSPHTAVRLKSAEPWPEESGVPLARSQGVSGAGVIVGVLDTGIDADHAEFRGRRVNFRYVPLNAMKEAVRNVRGFDVDGHGTHVCGIIAGQNVGVAPDVDLLVASVIESETLKTSFDRVLIGLDWMLSHFQLEENQAKPTIVNMSLGFPTEVLKLAAYKSALDALRKVLRVLLEDFEVLPVVAIGNDGPGKMRAPGFFPEVLSVGAVGADFEPALFSGGGTSPLTGKTTPDVAGFGVDIVSSYERTMSNRSRYVRMSGTSMATPYVTGIAALYAAADPTLQGDALRARVVADALPLDRPADRVGAGLARYV